MGAIETGLLALISVERADTEAEADRLLKKMLSYRVFADTAGKMNLDLEAVEGGLLLVPQFTLAADTKKGLRPSFSRAAPPQLAEQLFSYFRDCATKRYRHVQSGIFGADMQVQLINDGPVTFWLQT